MKNLPAIKDLYASKEVAIKNDEFTVLMNQPPAPDWVKKHPFIRNYLYIPIERVEFLLKSIFKVYRIEILREGQSFNGVYVVVRVHYLHPVTNQMESHDGIGALQLQLRAQTREEKDANVKVMFSSENLSNGAISMAYPIAKTVAVKDACDHFGKLFGSDLNRKDTINYTVDLTLQNMDKDHPNWAKVCEAIKGGKYTIENIEEKYDLTDDSRNYLNQLK